MIQEQITRVLLERLIVNRPHPWGLLITFIELIKVMFIAPMWWFFGIILNHESRVIQIILLSVSG